MAEYNPEKARAAQAALCKEKDYPYFAPRSGICWRCNRDIYKPMEHDKMDYQTGQVVGTFITGITVNKAATELVTGCPHCNRSYCD